MLEFAKLNVWESVVVETKVVGGWASMRRLGFANSSTCAFELAESRMVGGLAQCCAVSNQSYEF